MGRRNVHWSPSSNDPVSVSNNRVCLALLRIFRSVPLAITVHNYDDVAKPFWPLIQMERTLLKKGIQHVLKTTEPQGAKRGKARFPDDDELSALTDSLALADSTKAVAELPGDDVLRALGGAMLCDTPSFRPLFDAIESRLEKLVAKQPLASDSNIDLLSRSLELTPVEIAFLSLCSSIEQADIDSSTFCHAKHPLRRVQALRVALNQPSEHDIYAALSPNSKLIRSGLLMRDGSLHRDLEDILCLSKKGTALLSSAVQSADDMAAIVLKPLTESKATMPLEWPHLQEKTDLLQSLLVQCLEKKDAGINILLYGTPGTGKTEYARHLIEKVGARGFQIDDTDDKHSPASCMDRLASMGLSQIFAPAKESVLVLDEAEDIFQNDYNNPFSASSSKDEQSKSWMNNLLENNRSPVIWISNKIGHIDPAYLRRFAYCLEFPTTPRGVRRNIAKAHLTPVGCSTELMESVASSEYVSPALLASAARFVKLSGASASQVDSVTRNMLSDHLKAMGKEMPAHVPMRATRFDLNYLNVKGNVTPANVLDGLKRLGRGTLLLGGPPGTGKTQLAAEIAQQLGRELVYKTAADINSKWYGESERNVAKMFTECDASNEVLFLDEADTLLGARESAGQRADKAVTAEFLRRVEAFEGIFVCATNHSADFDSALMRRFVFRMNFLPLSAEQRGRLLYECALGWNPECGTQSHVPNALQSGRLGKLDQLTPGDFANVVKRVRTLQLKLSLDGWLDELQAEHDAKPSAARTVMGFM